MLNIINENNYIYMDIKRDISFVIVLTICYDLIIVFVITTNYITEK